MKRLLILGLLSVSTGGVRADHFVSTVYEVTRARSGSEPHLIKFDTGRVVFLDPEDRFLFRTLRDLARNRNRVSVRVDMSNYLVAASSRVAAPDGAAPVGSARQRSYEPTVLTSPDQALAIFKNLRRDHQYESQCYNRAHVWAYEEFRRTGLRSKKLFLFFTNRYIRNYRYKWWFHVAPLTFVQTRALVLDRRYTRKPLETKLWTDEFMVNRSLCPEAKKYTDYSQNQESQDCYLIPVSMYYWQPRDILAFERTGKEKTSFIKWELDHAYWEAY